QPTAKTIKIKIAIDFIIPSLWFKFPLRNHRINSCFVEPIVRRNQTQSSKSCTVSRTVPRNLAQVGPIFCHLQNWLDASALALIVFVTARDDCPCATHGGAARLPLSEQCPRG